MNVVIQGRQHRFVGGSLGDKPITEIWLGDKQIWPNTEGLARRIVVELPKKGTRDWQYWVHALQATENKAAPNNYMRFEHEGVPYYINHSADGTEPYRLDGNALTVELDGILIDQLGDYLEVEANIASREGETQVIKAYETTYAMDWDMPLIAGTQFKIKLTNYSSKKSSYGAVTEFYSMPSGKAFPGFGVSKHQRTRITGADTVKEEDVPVDDTACKAQAYTTGGCYYIPSEGKYQYVVPVWPAFKRKFKLKIISVS